MMPIGEFEMLMDILHVWLKDNGVKITLDEWADLETKLEDFHAFHILREKEKKRNKDYQESI